MHTCFGIPVHLEKKYLKIMFGKRLEPQYVLYIEPQSLSIQKMLFELVVKSKQQVFLGKENLFESSTSIAMNYQNYGEMN